jgi:uncharacterized protein YndB with AHSA1/START domain
MRSTEHTRFSVERRYLQLPSQVFRFWADPKLKAGWFCNPGAEYELDFRVGGQEINRDGTPGGPGYTYIARYSDIVEGQRIVYTYELHTPAGLASVSATSVQFAEEDGAGTLVTVTELIIGLDGRDTAAAREQGTSTLLDRVAQQLATDDREQSGRRSCGRSSLGQCFLMAVRWALVSAPCSLRLRSSEMARPPPDESPASTI